MAISEDNFFKFCISEFLIEGIHSFRDTIGEEDEDIAGFKSKRFSLKS